MIKAIKEVLRVYTELRTNGHCEALQNDVVDKANKEFEQLEANIRHHEYETTSAQEMHARYIQENHKYAEVGKALYAAVANDYEFELPSDMSEFIKTVRIDDGDILKMLEWYRTEVSNV